MPERPAFVCAVVAMTVIALTACSTTGPVAFGVATSRLESPEANGGFGRGHVTLGSQSEHQVILTHDYGLQDISTTSPSVQSLAEMETSGSLGLTEHLDAGVVLTSDSPLALKLKYQFLGESRAHAKPGNFSLAAEAGLSGSRASGSGIPEAYVDNLIPSPVTASYRLNVGLIDGGLILGYRFSREGLLYGGSSIQFIRYSGMQTDFANQETQFAVAGLQTTQSLGLVLGNLPAAASRSEPDSAPHSELAETPHPQVQFFGQLEASLSTAHLLATTSTSLNGALCLGIGW